MPPAYAFMKHCSLRDKSRMYAYFDEVYFNLQSDCEQLSSATEVMSKSKIHNTSFSLL